MDEGTADICTEKCAEKRAEKCAKNCAQKCAEKLSPLGPGIFVVGSGDDLKTSTNTPPENLVFATLFCLLSILNNG